MATILVIDDEALIRSTLRDFLKNAGHKVTEARDGADGVKAFHAKSHDLVLTDIIMPGKDGIATISQLRRDFPGIKIIAMSGGGETHNPQFLDLARRYGAIGQLTKPFTKDELLHVVNEALTQSVPA